MHSIVSQREKERMLVMRTCDLRRELDRHLLLLNADIINRPAKPQNSEFDLPA